MTRKMLSRCTLSLLPVCVLLAACTGAGHDQRGPASLKEVLNGFGERAGLLLESDPYGDRATRLVYLKQGWGPAETLWYYHADQGSVLMPYDTLIHLEQADNDKPFIAPEHLLRFRLLNQHKTPNNPDALPVGFARHGDQVGLTCAACHTGQINYQGTALRIDGAPALVDMIGFFHALQAALAATLADEDKLGRYAAAVPPRGPADVQAARQSLTKTLGWFEDYDRANRSTTLEGFGRLDAIGRIINQVIRFTSSPRNSLEPNAPTNFPLLWDAPRHDYVQWTGFAPNADGGSLGRNAGEVFGVFGHVDVKHYETQQEAKKGYPSTIPAHELVAMEEALWNLQSPRWPEEVLPKIDASQATRGAALYKVHCLSCHALLDRADPLRRVTAIMTGADIVGTDPQSAQNLAGASAPTGVLAGAISPKGDKYGDKASVLSLVIDLDTRVLSAQPVAALQAITGAKLHGLKKTVKQGNYTKNSDAHPTAELLAYKARPLNGTWASSPYLHNGSVPTLYDLLLPASQRPKTFTVGRWEYDARKVGYVSAGQVPFVYDTAVTGNSNRGHEYGTMLSDDERWALVEYLKKL